MLRLAIRNLLRQRVRASLTLAAIALGVASLVLSGGFVADILVRLRDATIHSQLGHLQVYKRGQFESGGHRPFDYQIANHQDVMKIVSSVPGVVAVGRRISFSGLLSNGRGELPILGEGVEPAAEAKIGSAFTILAGRQLSAADASGMVLGEGLASAMKLKVGDTASIVLSTREGAANTLDFTVVGVLRSLSKEYDARAVRITLPAAVELTAAEGVNAVVILLDDTDATERVRARLQHMLPPDLELKTWRDLADFYNNAAALYEREFGFLQAIIVVMVLLSVANSVNMTLHERTAEFGVIRALGRTSRHVFRLAVLETTVLGAVGAGLGILAGVAIALVVSAIGIPMAPPPNSETGFVATIRLVPAVLTVAFLVGVVASVVASLLPARQLARMELVEALRRGV